MLHRRYRLPPSEVKRLLQRGRRAAASGLQIIFQRQETAAAPRFSIVVPARITRQAVVRNRCRRLLREAIRHLLPNVLQGFDAIIVARDNISKQKQRGVRRDVMRLLENAKLFTLSPDRQILNS